MKGAFTGLAVAILSLIYTYAAADAGSTANMTGVVIVVPPSQSGGGGSNLNSNLQRNLHFGGFGKTNVPN